MNSKASAHGMEQPKGFAERTGRTHHFYSPHGCICNIDGFPFNTQSCRLREACCQTRSISWGICTRSRNNGNLYAWAFLGQTWHHTGTSISEDDVPVRWDIHTVNGLTKLCAICHSSINLSDVERFSLVMLPWLPPESPTHTLLPSKANPNGCAVSGSFTSTLTVLWRYPPLLVMVTWYEGGNGCQTPWASPLPPQQLLGASWFSCPWVACSGQMRKRRFFSFALEPTWSLLWQGLVSEPYPQHGCSVLQSAPVGRLPSSSWGWRILKNQPRCSCVSCCSSCGPCDPCALYLQIQDKKREPEFVFQPQ